MIPADAKYTKAYYFCHIHAGMSAEIEITGAIFTGIQESEQKAIAAFDEACGTYDATAFDPDSTHSTCSGKNFLCGAGASDTYANCLKAIDCKMHHDMAVSVAGTEDQDQAWAEGLARGIISVQNHQIQQMSGWLEANPTLAGVSTQCYADKSSWSVGSKVETSVGSHTVASATIQTGKSCTPTDTTTEAGTITLKLKFNSHASEWGAYTVEGCTGVNPKLSLTAGTTYTFVQSDASNWYHPIGFAYIAGGAHTSCKDAPEGVCPELDENTIKYYIDGVPAVGGGPFGLDAYEPAFFNSQDEWGGKTFKATLMIPADAKYTKAYYFCHIHAGMSAEIEIT